MNELILVIDTKSLYNIQSFERRFGYSFEITLNVYEKNLFSKHEKI